MNKYIYGIPFGLNYTRYQINILTLQARERHVDSWTDWRNISDFDMGFYKSVEPKIFDKRNKLIHSIDKKNV